MEALCEVMWLNFYLVCTNEKLVITIRRCCFFLCYRYQISCFIALYPFRSVQKLRISWIGTIKKFVSLRVSRKNTCGSFWSKDILRVLTHCIGMHTLTNSIYLWLKLLIKYSYVKIYIVFVIVTGFACWQVVFDGWRFGAVFFNPCGHMVRFYLCRYYLKSVSTIFLKGN